MKSFHPCCGRVSFGKTFLCCSSSVCSKHGFLVNQVITKKLQLLTPGCKPQTSACRCYFLSHAGLHGISNSKDRLGNGCCQNSKPVSNLPAEPHLVKLTDTELLLQVAGYKHLWTLGRKVYQPEIMANKTDSSCFNLSGYLIGKLYSFADLKMASSLHCF